jgi:hypothetical protein
MNTSHIKKSLSPDKFYKRGSQEKHYSYGRIVSDSPARAIEGGFVLAWCPRDSVFPSQRFHPVAVTTPIVFETHKQGGCRVPTMVLSETRGLWLFRVVRGGIGSTRGARCTGHAGPNLSGGYSPSNPSVSRTRLATTGNDPEMERARCEALKLLVVSGVRRRNELLSSRGSK